MREETASIRTAIRCVRCTGSPITSPQRGDPLRAGMVVTTGSYCGIVEVPLDEPLTFAYGDSGRWRSR